MTLSGRKCITSAVAILTRTAEMVGVAEIAGRINISASAINNAAQPRVFGPLKNNKTGQEHRKITSGHLRNH
jgi:hypothetical protein